MFIPDPDFYPSRVPDKKTATKERGGENKFVFIPFSVVTYFSKLKIFYPRSQITDQGSKKAQDHKSGTLHPGSATLVIE
jgi:hypothetical protein